MGVAKWYAHMVHKLYIAGIARCNHLPILSTSKAQPSGHCRGGHWGEGNTETPEGMVRLGEEPQKTTDWWLGVELQETMDWWLGEEPQETMDWWLGEEPQKRQTGG